MSAPAFVPHPLSLRPRLDSRLWGGDRLARWMGLSDAPSPLAEAWLVFDENVVAGGPYSGLTLAQVVELAGAALLGTSCVDRFGPRFPLLTKFIDAADDLSVQVHPDDATAVRIEGSGHLGKSEAWFILDATPGAELFHGFAQPVDREGFQHALSSGGVTSLLRRLPARPGEALLVPAGTIHAIRAGVMLFEVQQRSDLTYRVYDYDRKDKDGRTRALHVTQALESLRFAVGGPSPVGSSTGNTLISTDKFRLRRWVGRGREARSTDPRSFEIVTVIRGDVTLEHGGGTELLNRGASLVLPATLGGYGLRAGSEAEVLFCDVLPA